MKQTWRNKCSEKWYEYQKENPRSGRNILRAWGKTDTQSGEGRNPRERKLIGINWNKNQTNKPPTTTGLDAEAGMGSECNRKHSMLMFTLPRGLSPPYIRTIFITCIYLGDSGAQLIPPSLRPCTQGQQDTRKENAVVGNVFLGGHRRGGTAIRR